MYFRLEFLFVGFIQVKILFNDNGVTWALVYLAYGKYQFIYV